MGCIWKQLDFFFNTVGIHKGKNLELKSLNNGELFTKSELDRKLNFCSFTKMSELPKGTKPIKALSNGSIVTCYYYNDGETLHWFRPNPNYKNIFQPLTTEDHIAHRRIYGLY